MYIFNHYCHTSFTFITPVLTLLILFITPLVNRSRIACYVCVCLCVIYFLRSPKFFFLHLTIVSKIQIINLPLRPAPPPPSADAWGDSERDYSYDELLQRAFDQLREKNPEMAAGEKKKFIMKPPQVRLLFECGGVGGIVISKCGGRCWCC